MNTELTDCDVMLLQDFKSTSPACETFNNKQFAILDIFQQNFDTTRHVLSNQIAASAAMKAIINKPPKEKQVVLRTLLDFDMVKYGHNYMQVPEGLTCCLLAHTRVVNTAGADAVQQFSICLSELMAEVGRAMNMMTTDGRGLQLAMNRFTEYTSVFESSIKTSFGQGTGSHQRIDHVFEAKEDLLDWVRIANAPLRAVAQDNLQYLHKQLKESSDLLMAYAGVVEDPNNYSGDERRRSIDILRLKKISTIAYQLAVDSVKVTTVALHHQMIMTTADVFSDNVSSGRVLEA